MKLLFQKYKLYIIGGAVVLFFIFLFWNPVTQLAPKTATVTRGTFSTTVEATGEVQALQYESINAPSVLKERELRIWSIKITNLIDEGTKVQKGDFVASLDPSEVVERIKEVQENLSEYTLSKDNAVLDSAISLMSYRDKIQSALYDITEKEITLEQSKFESKAIQRSAEIDLQLAQLTYQGAVRSLEKETNRHKLKIQRLNNRIIDTEKTINKLNRLKDELTIFSPSDGMIIYGRDHHNEKIKVNGEVGPWTPTIATIPDLNTLVSEAVVKEVDIAKVKKGQAATILIDAFPNTVFKGEIIKIANIGEELQNTGMNGFSVMIKMDTQNKKVLPSMTTTNKITTSSFKNELLLPREAIFGNDTIKYVFKKQGGKIVKTFIETGGENETHMRIIGGVNEGEQVLLSRPDEYIEQE